MTWPLAITLYLLASAVATVLMCMLFKGAARLDEQDTLILTHDMIIRSGSDVPYCRDDGETRNASSVVPFPLVPFRGRDHNESL